MNRVYWDTTVFAYLLEGSPEFGERARAAYETITARGDTICTSVFTVGELLVLPRKVRSQQVISAIQSFMQSGEVDLLPFTLNTAVLYSEVRAESKIKAADAIHVATAISARANFFLTNDIQLQKQRIPRMPYLLGLDGRYF